MKSYWLHRSLPDSAGVTSITKGPNDPFMVISSWGPASNYRVVLNLCFVNKQSLSGEQFIFTTSYLNYTLYENIM